MILSTSEMPCIRYYLSHPSDAPWEVINTNTPLRWRHNERDSVSNHQPHHCFLNRLFRRRSKKAPRHWPLWGEFTAQMASYAENVSIWWRHHAVTTHWPFKRAPQLKGTVFSAGSSGKYALWQTVELPMIPYLITFLWRHCIAIGRYIAVMSYGWVNKSYVWDSNSCYVIWDVKSYA